MESLIDKKFEELEDRIHILENCMDKLLKSNLIHKEVSKVLQSEIEEVCRR